jgi:23S rRNA (uracil-5-)-methyltransferase RumA
MSRKKYNISDSSDRKPQNIGVTLSNGGSMDESPTLEIHGLAAGGRGIARHEGMVWFVAGGLPGDHLVAKAAKRHRRYVEGRLLRIVEPSKLRREPVCKFQPHCGGCPWMPLPEREQREWKQKLIEEASSRIARIDPAIVEEIRAPVKELGYRNRVEFKLGTDRTGTPAVGFHPSGGGRELVDIDHCHLQHDAANAVLRTARKFLLGSSQQAGDYRLTIRRSEWNGRILVVLRETSRPFPGAKKLSNFITRRHSEVSGVALLRGSSGRRGGSSAVTLAGRPWIEERIGTLEFRAGAATFLQVSSPGATELIRLVRECAGAVEDRAILDLYGGVGSFGFSLLERGAKAVVVCDADGQAIECGRRTARRLEERRISFTREAVEDFLSHSGPRGRAADVIIANPPRAGLGAGVVGQIVRRDAATIVLVSCDPATLARDIRLLEEGGYSARRVVPVDLFPQTAHVESVAHLARR